MSNILLLACFALTMASATPGDSLGNITLAPPLGGYAVAVDCTGAIYWTGYSQVVSFGESTLFKTNTNGDLFPSVSIVDPSISQPVLLDSLTWDSTRGKLWGAGCGLEACEKEIWSEVYLLDPRTGHATLQWTVPADPEKWFNGIVFDPRDETLWLSLYRGANVTQHNVYTGAIIRTITPKDADGSDNGNVGGIWLSDNDMLVAKRQPRGEDRVDKVSPVTGNFISTFIPLTGRGTHQSMACDTVNYYPKIALYIRGGVYPHKEIKVFETDSCITCPPKKHKKHKKYKKHKKFKHNTHHKHHHRYARSHHKSGSQSNHWGTI